jgi:hypothetical protein
MNATREQFKDYFLLEDLLRTAAGAMILWSTCSQCGLIVKGTRILDGWPNGPESYIDTYEPHLCEELPDLSTMKHITYHEAHANSAFEGNNGKENSKA